LIGADDVGIAAGADVDRDHGAGLIDENAFGLGAAAIDADFIVHRRMVNAGFVVRQSGDESKPRNFLPRKARNDAKKTR